MTDIYSAPEANLTEAVTVDGYGSLEKGIAGDYHFAIGEVISEAWAKTKGAKGTFWLAFLIYIAIGFGAMFAIGAVLGVSMMAGGAGEEAGGASMVLSQLGSQLVSIVVMGPMGAGLFIMALRRSVNADISAGMVLNYFGKIVPILLTTILMYIMIIIGLILFILPGIYLAVGYYMAIPLVVEKNLGPWAALEASRKAVSKRWFSVFGLFLVLGLINFAGIFTLGILWIWTLPMTLIAFGILYRNIFGVEAETLSS